MLYNVLKSVTALDKCGRVDRDGCHCREYVGLYRQVPRHYITTVINCTIATTVGADIAFSMKGSSLLEAA
jgi:hypothetical protein